MWRLPPNLFQFQYSPLGQSGVRLIPNRVDILKRPVIVEERKRLGDWEGDTVHGQNAHLVTLIDRTSRFTLVQRVFTKTT